MRRIHTSLRLCAEPLELRQLLSVNAPALDPNVPAETVELTAPAPVESTRAAEIAQVTLLVNNVPYQFGPHASLQLSAGDTLEVGEIAFSTDWAEGIFAAEAYVHKLTTEHGASTVDGADGRYSARDKNIVATGASAVLPGVEGSWTVEEGWNRLTVSLVHYQQDAPTQTLGRLAITLQVGEPDLVFDVDVLAQVEAHTYQVGEPVSLPGRFWNGGTGLFHNYAEVDIYHASDLNRIVWAGAVVGNAGTGQDVVGEFVNLRDDDPFTEQWTPDVEGEYLLKYYLDPEFVASETDEQNNFFDARVQVGSASETDLVAEDLEFTLGQRVQAVSSSAIWGDPQIVHEEDFDEGSFTGVLDPAGDDTATSGRWQVANPVRTTEWQQTPLQIAGDGGVLVTGNGLSVHDRFQESNFVRIETLDEGESEWRLEFRNRTGRTVENWAVHIEAANYELDLAQLVGAEGLNHHAFLRGDGTWDHYLVGQGPLEGRVRRELSWQNPPWQQSPASEGATGGVVADHQVGDDDIDGGVTTVQLPSVTLPDADRVTLSVDFNFAYLENATSDDFLSFTIVGEHTTRELHVERAAPQRQPAAWQTLELDLSEFAGEQVSLRIQAADSGSRSLVEAAVDNVLITSAQLETLRVASFTQPRFGTVTLLEDGITFDYVPDPGHEGDDSFTYRLTDGTSLSNLATVTINTPAP